jgi:chemotaxis protein CheD
MTHRPPAGASAGAAAQLTLLPGDVRCRAEPTILTTVLGSCVAVCLWDITGGAGGMNHFVLPVAAGGERSSRYGDVAMEDLLAGLVGLGARQADLRAKVFGGAAVLVNARGESVGSGNVRLALRWLRRAGIPIAARRTGGVVGQHIRFHTGSGEALVRFVTGGFPGEGLAGGGLAGDPASIATRQG